MGLFGGGSPKMHKLFSNDGGWLEAICSKANYMSRADQAKCEVKTTRQYQHGNGQKRCVGVKKALKESAYPSLINF